MNPEPAVDDQQFKGGSNLQNGGSGNWQFNWATQKGYSNQCRTMKVRLAQPGLSDSGGAEPHPVAGLPVRDLQVQGEVGTLGGADCAPTFRTIPRRVKSAIISGSARVAGGDQRLERERNLELRLALTTDP